MRVGWKSDFGKPGSLWDIYTLVPQRLESLVSNPRENVKLSRALRRIYLRLQRKSAISFLFLAAAIPSPASNHFHHHHPQTHTHTHAHTSIETSIRGRQVASQELWSIRANCALTRLYLGIINHPCPSIFNDHGRYIRSHMQSLIVYTRSPVAFGRRHR